eukprot:6213984-Pleurochrysis_carterae.AAC.3
MLYAPGERLLLPRLMPTQALDSIRHFEYDGRGFTANARQPNGRILMMRGFSPASISYEEAFVLGGPVV